jgi:hypothetical protein
MTEYFRPIVRRNEVQGFLSLIDGKYIPVRFAAKAERRTLKMVNQLGGGTLEELQQKFKAAQKTQAIARFRKYAPGEPLPEELR